MNDFQVPNHLAAERLAAGIARPEDLAARAQIDPKEYEHIEAGRLVPTAEQFRRIQAALGGIADDRLYGGDIRQIMGVTNYVTGVDHPKGVMDWVGAPMRLFVARDEVTWMADERVMPSEPVDVFFTFSCGTRAMPHFLLDGIAVAKALGIRFAVASGPAGCCGKPFLAKGHAEAGEAFTMSKLRYAEAIGAKTIVMSCHACQQTAAITMSRREIFGVPQPNLRHLWTGSFFAEEVERLGDRVPWKRRLSRRVVLDWHDGLAGTVPRIHEDMARLLSLIPGVTVVGRAEGELAEVRPCSALRMGRYAGATGISDYPRWTPPEEDARERTESAAHLADLVQAQGGDTVSSTHFSCHQMWGRYASDGMNVRHPVSILAEALGVENPDRAQAAARLGDPQEVVRQTRRNWQSWGLTEEQALGIATSSIYPTTGGLTGCTCGTHEADDVIPIDVMLGAAPGLSRAR